MKIYKLINPIPVEIIQEQKKLFSITMLFTILYNLIL